MADDTELAKELGLFSALTIGIGTMVGAGIFVLPGAVAEAAGPAAALAFVVAGFIALFTALSISELGTAMPKAGGGYYYINDALGPLFGSIAGWGNWLGLAFATAFYMIGFGSYLTIYVPLPDIMFLSDSQIGALIAAVVFVGINYYGAKETGSVQVIIVTILLIVLTIFTIIGFFNLNTAYLQPFAPAETGGYSAILPAAGLIFVTYLGFAEINTVAEEMRNPGRNLPLAVIGSLLFVIAFYAVIMIVLMGVEPYYVIADYGEEAVARAAESMMGPIGLLVLTIGGLLATASSANASILASSRINFAMGRDRIISEWINEVHADFFTPYRSIVITGAIILTFILIGDIETLAKAGSVLHLIVYGLLNIALIVYRESHIPSYDPDFTVPLYPYVPILGAVLSFALIGFMAREEILLSIGFVVFGGIWYVFYAKQHADSRSLVGSAISPANGNDDEDPKYRVVVPIVNPETQQNIVRLAAICARADSGEGEGEVIAVNVVEVPRQTSLQQKVEYEQKRIDRQREILENARETIQEMDVTVRTRGIVGRDAGTVILDVLKEEQADQVILGWRKQRSRREYVFGSTIDPIIKRAPCEVDLVRLPNDSFGNVAALAGPGPHTPVAVRRAVECAESEHSRATLINAQRTPSEESQLDSESPDPTERGKKSIEKIAEQAGIESSSYNDEVLVGDNVTESIRGAIGEYDTVCIGMSEETTFSRILYGSVAKQVTQSAEGNVILTRGPREGAKSVREALIERFLSR